jgi:hypothetical protein
MVNDVCGVAVHWGTVRTTWLAIQAGRRGYWNRWQGGAAGRQQLDYAIVQFRAPDLGHQVPEQGPIHQYPPEILLDLRPLHSAGALCMLSGGTALQCAWSCSTERHATHVT